MNILGLGKQSLYQLKELLKETKLKATQVDEKKKEIVMQKSLFHLHSQFV